MQFSVSKKIVPVIALTFINFLNFSIIIPILPFLSQEFKIGNLAYGILLALYPVAQILCVQLFASLSNKFGRRPVILITQFGTMLSWLIFCLAYFLPNILVFSIWPLPILVIAIARIADGITGANMLVANAYVADITSKENRVRTFAKTEAAVAVGSLVGPIAGSFLISTPLSFLAAGLFAFFVSLIGLIVIYFTLDESLKEKRANLEIHFFESLNFMKKILNYRNNKVLMMIFSQRFVFQVIFNAFITIIFPYLIILFNINKGSNIITIILTIFGVLLFLNQLFLVPWAVEKYGATRVFFVGQILMILALLTFGLVQFLPVLWIAFILLMFGVSTSLSLFKPFLTSNVSQQNQTEVIAIEEQIMTFTASIGPLLGVFAYELFSQKTFAVFAVFGILSAIVIKLIFGSFYLQEGDEEAKS